MAYLGDATLDLAWTLVLFSGVDPCKIAEPLETLFSLWYSGFLYMYFVHVLP